MTLDLRSIPEPFSSWADRSDSILLDNSIRFWVQRLKTATGRRPGELKWRFPEHSLPLDWLDSFAASAEAAKPSGSSSTDRNALGEFYTPAWLVDRTIDRLWSLLSPAETWCDPTAGDGAFLAALVRRGLPVDRLFGCDVNPFSVVAAAANIAWAAFQSTGRPLEDFVVPLACIDLLGDFISTELLQSADIVVGNPPWQVWDRMPDASRESARKLWRHYGLFTERGMASILGGAKKDLSALLTLRVADLLLKPQGRLGFVLPESLFSSSGGGRGFRRFQLPDGTPIRVEEVLDLAKIDVFKGATVRSTVVWMTKGEATRYPVPYVVCRRCGRAASRRNSASTIEETREEASPSDPSDPLSAWRHVAAGRADFVGKVLGQSAYRAHLGVNTGGANGVYWLERIRPTTDGLWLVRNIAASSRRPLEAVEFEIESQNLHPLLRGKDVQPWSATPSAWLLSVQDPLKRRGIDVETLGRIAPRTFAYLQRFEEVLRERAALERYFRPTDPFYSMFNVGEYTLSPWKTVWQRMGSKLAASVVGEFEGRLVMPQETHAFFPAESKAEACFLAALLQNRWVREAMESIAQVGGKSFATPRTIERIAIRKFDPANAIDARLACLGEEALSKGAADVDLQTAIDAAAAEYWGIEPTAT